MKKLTLLLAILVVATCNVSAIERDFGMYTTMVKVEGGKFFMGDTGDKYLSKNADNVPHEVVLSTFWISKFEVTQQLWNYVMKTNPSSFTGSNLPVTNVSWDECQEFIRRLNSITGEKFRLPTEAEWEYAARGGQKGHDYPYSGNQFNAPVAWADADYPKSVASLAPNELGLYDMSGNVAEWCQDRYNYRSYWESSWINPTGPSSGSSRVVRGGSFLDHGYNCTVWKRGCMDPSNKCNYVGLRLAMSSND